ncbi:MAG TPA: terminase family protein [Candidatus Acidoferrales bacterium]|nr:terminase family protein [Candidatus Acidoferrales bacterium]
MRNYSEKEARAFRPSRILPEWQETKQRHLRLKQTVHQQFEDLSDDPVEFIEQILGQKLYDYQKEFVEIFENNQFTAARWCRQSGKTQTISALLLKYAIKNPDVAIGIVGPSWRQTKRILARINALCRKLPPGIVLKPQKTQIDFDNGSSIEAFPNNPETIRGPTLHVVYADEFNFVANDQELYDAILYTLGTTDGKFVCSSTPWHTDSVFFKIFSHKDFADFKTSHITVEQAMEPNGPLKPAIVQKIKTQMGDDPIRWRREMMAEWAEDQDVWLTQSLIASCIGTAQNCGEDLKEYGEESERRGLFFAGIDLAQTRDYTVIAVIESRNDKLFLRHLKIFQQPTIYATVLGYLKMLQDRWGRFRKIRVDFTREGPSIIADMQAAGIYNVEGVAFSVPRKSEMASVLKQRMASQQFFYPLLHWERPYRGEICTELNVERYSLNKDGTIGYHHTQGTHDDVFWAIALSVYATADMGPEPFLVVVPRG